MHDKHLHCDELWEQELSKNNSDIIQTARIRITQVGRKSTVVILEGKELRTNRASFYVDISIIKESTLKSIIQINKEKFWQ
jgi:hypothetical protein